MFTIVFDGITFTIISALWFIMTAAGPTDVAGTKGNTAALVNQSTTQIQRLR